MNDKELYESYTSDETIEIRRKDYFCEQSGIPNKDAFNHFTDTIDIDQEYRLVCLNIDLNKPNKEQGYEAGSRTMRKFYLALLDLDVFVFRICGEKFNILCRNDQLETVKAFLDEDHSDQYRIYYGIPDDTYSIFTAQEVIEEGKNLMYKDREEKAGIPVFSSEKQEDSENPTPVDLRETSLHKYRSTMWYDIIKINVALSKNEWKEYNVYVFPTQKKEPYESIPLVVVADDYVEYKVCYGNDIELVLEGYLIRINARFDKEGELVVSVFPERKDIKKIKTEFLEKKAGICIPEHFGKYTEDGEIYPIKRNINGLTDYVLLKGEEAVMDTTGLVTVGGETYGVFMTDEDIDLVKQ